MKQIVILALAFCFRVCECKIRSFGNGIERGPDPDRFRNVSSLISSKGYPVEDHTVQTADGFILSMQRIPHGRKHYSKGDKKQVVFLQHGFLAAASCWVINFPEQSLGFILADEGYDVWLGNNRGNTYSKRHVKYSTNESQFWDFSFDEMAQYDLPAMIDYVLNVTKEEKLFYIGHSQGTLIAFALLTEKQEYNEKIKLFIALAPVTTVGYIASDVRYLVPYANGIRFLFRILGTKELLPSSPILKNINAMMCDSGKKAICENVIFGLLGTDKKQLNETRLGVYSAHMPAGASVKNLIHFGQMANSKKFTKYDYGKRNKEYYNQTTPPEYDVSRITTPVALVWSMNDKLADPHDVDILRGKLKSMVSSYCVPLPEFNHIDFLVAVDARKLLYDHVLSLLTHY